MNKDSHEPVSLSYDQLLEQNRSLYAQLSAYQEQESFIWDLFVEASRKFQVYTASIKAAVSSLLDNNILWDNANQHEFLQTIDKSVNQVSNINALLTLAFRAQANSLVLSKDYHLLQEILLSSQASVLKRIPNLRLDIFFPREGKPVFVDYEYLTTALALLYEVLFVQSGHNPIQVIASEDKEFWLVEFVGANPEILRVIEQMHNCKTQPKANEALLAENILRLHVICEILHLQQISIDVLDGAGAQPTLRFRVPELTAM